MSARKSLKNLNPVPLSFKLISDESECDITCDDPLESRLPEQFHKPSSTSSHPGYDNIETKDGYRYTLGKSSNKAENEYQTEFRPPSSLSKSFLQKDKAKYHSHDNQNIEQKAHRMTVRDYDEHDPSELEVDEIGLTTPVFTKMPNSSELSSKIQNLKKELDSILVKTEGVRSRKLRNIQQKTNEISNIEEELKYSKFQDKKRPDVETAHQLEHFVDELQNMISTFKEVVEVTPPSEYYSSGYKRRHIFNNKKFSRPEKTPVVNIHTNYGGELDTVMNIPSNIEKKEKSLNAYNSNKLTKSFAYSKKEAFKTSFSVASDKNPKSILKKSKGQRSVRFDVDNEKEPEHHTSPRRTLFSRSKSRDGPPSGIVPATKIGFMTLRSNNSVYDEKGVFQVFSSGKPSPVSAKYDKRSRMATKELDPNGQTGKRRRDNFEIISKPFNPFRSVNLTNKCDKLDEASEQSSLTRDEQEFDARVQVVGKTKRRRFLDKCYETQDRFLNMLNRTMRRSETRTPNRELVELCNTIKNVNKADLYETVLNKHIREREWEKFLNEVYGNPERWI